MGHGPPYRAGPGPIAAPDRHPAQGKSPMSLEFSAEAQRKIAALCERYPSKRPVILAALHLAQKEFGHLSDDALRLVARVLDLPYPHVYGVATFYTMFRREPAGKNVLRVCTNISCMLRGAYDVLDAFEQRLGVKKGGTAGDFTIVEEECIAACANAPAIVCGTKYFLDVTPEQVGEILDYLRKNPHPESEVA
jgi:NADH-quinone oxidoreductase E subunit